MVNDDECLIVVHMWIHLVMTRSDYSQNNSSVLENNVLLGENV